MIVLLNTFPARPLRGGTAMQNGFLRFKKATLTKDAHMGRLTHVRAVVVPHTMNPQL